MSERKFPKLTHSQKIGTCLGITFAIVILGIISFFSQPKSEMVLKTAILSEDTAFYMSPDMEEAYSGVMKKGDLINVVYKHSDGVYYVLDAGTEMPMNEGYLPQDKFTYDFDTANQAVLGTHIVYSNKDTKKPAGYVVEKGRTRCIVSGFDGDFASISLPGGIDGLWVEKEYLIYDLNYDPTEAEGFGCYSLVKDYMEKEYVDTYDKYYSHNYVARLSAYDEEFDRETNTLTAEFIMNGMSKNNYRDPDSVKYIKEAKESASSDVDKIYYETLYREYNMYKTSNFILRLTAKYENDQLKDVELYSDMGVGAESDWKKLEKGLKDFIID